MKRFILFFTIISLLFFGFFYKNTLIENFNSIYYHSVCDNPTRYKIGFVDPRFNMSNDELLSDIAQASSIWSDIAGKNLFVYDKKGPLTINLVFDKRQALNNEIINLQNELKTKKDALDPEIAQYEKDAENFKKKINDLNNEISYWNGKGGAPPDEYIRLGQEQKKLKEEADRLNATAERLNQTNNLFNADVDRLNQTVDTLNNALGEKPEEGLYDGKENAIYIYFVTNQNEFIHTLTHELGHSLGITHVKDKNSIMYSYTSKQILPSPLDKNALNKICEKQSLLEIFLARLQLVIKNIKSTTNQAD